MRAGGEPSSAAWLDALIWTVGAATPAREPLLEPDVGSDLAPLANLTALAYC